MEIALVLWTYRISRKQILGANLARVSSLYTGNGWYVDKLVVEYTCLVSKYAIISDNRNSRLGHNSIVHVSFDQRGVLISFFRVDFTRT
jgi:hypothetical protein